MVRKMKPQQALNSLKFVRQAAASDLAKIINTALANTGHGMDENLVFKKLEVNEGFKLKRFRSAALGRIRKYSKKMSQVRIVLSDEVKGPSAGRAGQKLIGKNTSEKLKVTKEKGEKASGTEG